ncbi:MAG: 50S ribosomal protein L9 [Microscillaceae bacterium]|nr:50S ribosomal protein L9 [Microscillaceae bacterium]
MEVILKEDVQGLGYKNDLVNVKPGYGRNYLIPRGLAIAATDSTKKMLAENIRQAAHKAEKVKKDAEALASQIEGILIEITTKVSESGKIFGSVTNTQLADAMRVQGIDIDRRKISIVQKEIKIIGEYSAVVDLHKEVKPTLKFKVSGE